MVSKKAVGKPARGKTPATRTGRAKSVATARKGKVDWAAESEKIKHRVEQAWHDGGHALETMWHQSAIAALRWVNGHQGRVAGLRKAVKGTPIEKSLDAALAALRSEARAKAPKKTVRKRAVKRSASRHQSAR